MYVRIACVHWVLHIDYEVVGLLAAKGYNRFAKCDLCKAFS